MTVELSDDDRTALRWFAEDVLGWKKQPCDCWYDTHLWRRERDLLGWPGFGRVVEEARKAGYEVVMETLGVYGVYLYGKAQAAHGSQATAWAHHATDPALAAMAALGDALGAKP